MKSSIVPAQITTVEDRVAGSLTMHQLILLISALFLSFALYVIFPPSLHLNLYKLSLILPIPLACCVAAIRLRGKLILEWAITIAQFNLRPRHYVFNKNDRYLKEDYAPGPKDILVDRNISLPRPVPTEFKVSDEDALKIEGIIRSPNYRLNFITKKKGGLHVYVSEV